MRLLLIALLPFVLVGPAKAGLSFHLGEDGVYIDLDKREYRELRRYYRNWRHHDDYECRWFRRHRHHWRHWDNDWDKPRRKKGFYFNFDF